MPISITAAAYADGQGNITLWNSEFTLGLGPLAKLGLQQKGNRLPTDRCPDQDTRATSIGVQRLRVLPRRMGSRASHPNTTVWEGREMAQMHHKTDAGESV